MITSRSVPTGLARSALRSLGQPITTPCQQCRTFLRPARHSGSRAYETINLNRMRTQHHDYHRNRRAVLLGGALAGSIATCYTAYRLVDAVRNPTQFDAPASGPDKVDPFVTEGGVKRKTVIHDDEGRELVPTGNSTITTFPRTLDLHLGAQAAQEKVNGVEYTLVGLGVRTVSFLGIQVYMVGYYLATQDIAAIQARLVKEINPIATTLVANEKEELRKALLDPVQGEKLWTEILREVRPRSAFRIVPIRDTDFHHLRDAFVRAVQARSTGRPAEFGDDEFGTAMRDFRAVFNRGKFPKKQELLMVRDNSGHLTVTHDTSGTGAARETIGQIPEERITRLLWMNWLAGSKVASEPARQNIVEGIMEFVERPVGTVATQVV
ncbi:chalcone-flavanone isomerase-domain-containing protein [Microdochium trichocladiopsis]|uniref:Chalcone-flavanone isomerase-domain-containing protein n=1 Tax=Microdochium trichocladiopsis TaxID=1682393 RepID=A0A9P8YAN0_9PEZI|nr:chalcone-flavanone isomerase-domain-containing protein [Microdochium trichocladiopsis]KAH7032707.1 chalcone-flavanone isomerase-domain-containing protein [Microdochium trichocladiopsis]